MEEVWVLFETRRKFFHASVQPISMYNVFITDYTPARVLKLIFNRTEDNRVPFYEAALTLKVCPEWLRKELSIFTKKIVLDGKSLMIDQESRKDYVGQHKEFRNGIRTPASAH